MLHNAIPEIAEVGTADNYKDFLKVRSLMMAQTIREYYYSL
jgi:hypothetical protein